MKRLLAAAVVCSGVLSAASASAAPLQGTFNLSGQNEAEARVGADYIDFFDFDGTMGAPDGNFEVNGATVDFAFLAGLSVGTILDLYAEPVGVPISIDNFVEFTGQEQWNFQLQEIAVGAGSPAACLPPTIAGESCSPHQPGNPSPFTIVNLNNGGPPSIVSLSMSGIVDNGFGELSTFTATFTTPLDRFTAESAIAQIEDENIGFVQSSWAADFTVTPIDTPVPEPASLILMGMALTGMGFAIRRRR